MSEPITAETRLARLEEGHEQVVAALTAIDGSLDTLFEEQQKNRGLIGQLRKDIGQLQETVGQLQRTIGVMGQTIDSLDASYGRMANEVQAMKQTIQQVRRG